VSLLCCYYAVADVRKKWANLRTQFMKELREMEKKKKSGSGAEEGKSRWKYFGSMNFLTATAAPTPANRKSNLEVKYYYVSDILLD